MAISVFPERMNALEVGEPEKALGTVENYIHYMCERVEFSLSNFFRTIGQYGTSSAEQALILAAHDNTIRALETTTTAQAAAIQGKVDKVEGKGLSTNDYTDADKADVDSIDGLDERVTDLEAVITQSGPILIQNAEDVTAAEGDDAIFSVRALGTNLTYKWELYYSSSWTYPNFQGRDTPNMTVPATASRNLYRFRCTITGGGWTIYSKTVTLHVTS